MTRIFSGVHQFKSQSSILILFAVSDYLEEVCNPILRSGWDPIPLQSLQFYCDLFLQRNSNIKVRRALLTAKDVF